LPNVRVHLGDEAVPTPSGQAKKTFLPVRLSSCTTRLTDGASGGILTAWDEGMCSLIHSSELAYTLTTSFRLTTDNTEITVTNVHAPTTRHEKIDFLAELETVAANINGLWLIIRDFNLTRAPEDKSSDNFNISEATMLNSTISELSLIEIPLVDRAFTWTNRHANPTLVRLDRCFIHTSWDAVFPDTSLSSGTCFVSEHVPILASAATKFPAALASVFKMPGCSIVRFGPL
jgi:hypothetical protein